MNLLETSYVSQEENNEFTVCFLLKSFPIDLKRVAQETAKDDTSQDIITEIRMGWQKPHSGKKVNPFYSFRDELFLRFATVVSQTA